MWCGPRGGRRPSSLLSTSLLPSLPLPTLWNGPPSPPTTKGSTPSVPTTTSLPRLRPSATSTTARGPFRADSRKARKVDVRSGNTIELEKKLLVIAAMVSSVSCRKVLFQCVHSRPTCHTSLAWRSCRRAFRYAQYGGRREKEEVEEGTDDANTLGVVVVVVHPSVLHGGEAAEDTRRRPGRGVNGEGGEEAPAPPPPPPLPQRSTPMAVGRITGTVRSPPSHRPSSSPLWGGGDGPTTACSVAIHCEAKQCQQCN